MNNHTPAPWEVREDTQYPLHGIWANNSELPTYIARTCYAPSSEANAKLIAAAPELLEALNRVNNTLTVHGKVDSETPLHEFILAAIKKATE